METTDNTEFNKKIATTLSGTVVRKDLVKTVKGNAVVPTYVLEYLLAQYTSGDDETSISESIQAVRDILAKHYVQRNESGLVKSMIRENGSHQVIDKVQVVLNDKDDTYEAMFSNLGITGIVVPPEIVRKNEKLLVNGVWCICNIKYIYQGHSKAVPWILGSLKPIQLSHFDFDSYIEGRNEFSTDEWIDLLMQSIGFNPEMFTRREKLLHLVRLIPFVERNYNLAELGPKGTGKSHIYSEFSPHGMLISGGEVTVPKLFVNNTNGRIGLVGYWDVVAFDEFAGKAKRSERALVDILKNYMANKSFSRGIETLSAEASMVFVGNTTHTVPYMLKNGDLFQDLPPAYHDSAFIDRLHFYLPGWEFDPIRSEMFSLGYGFVVDYLAEALRSLRNLDYSDRFQDAFTLSSEISTRDRDGILKTFSGLMKLVFPHGKASVTEMQELLEFAIEGRKRVKDQILRIDPTMDGGRFGYFTGRGEDGEWHQVSSLEECENPEYYTVRASDDSTTLAGEAATDETTQAGKSENTTGVTENANQKPPAANIPQPVDGQVEFKDSLRGVSYEKLFAPYLRGATKILIVDPYISKAHQLRNLSALLAVIAKCKKHAADEVEVWLKTKEETENFTYANNQLDALEELSEYCSRFGIYFDFEFDSRLHDRSIVTDTGWRIGLGRGLDIFQRPKIKYDFGSFKQEFAQVRAFTIDYRHVDTDKYFQDWKHPRQD